MCLIQVIQHSFRSILTNHRSRKSVQVPVWRIQQPLIGVYGDEQSSHHRLQLETPGLMPESQPFGFPSPCATSKPDFWNVSTSVFFSSNFIGYVSPAPLLQAGSLTPPCLSSGLYFRVVHPCIKRSRQWVREQHSLFESIQHITFIVKSELLSLKWPQVQNLPLGDRELSPFPLST